MVPGNAQQARRGARHLWEFRSFLDELVRARYRDGEPIGLSELECADPDRLCNLYAQGALSRDVERAFLAWLAKRKKRR